MIRKWQFILVIMAAGACSGRAAVIYWNGNAAASTSVLGTDAAGIASAVFTDPAVNQSGSSAATLVGDSSSSSGYANASGGDNFEAKAKPAAFSTGTSTYFQVTLTPAAGYAITLDSVTLASRSTSTGPTKITLYSSVDDYSAAIGTVSGLTTTGSNPSWAMLGPPLSGSLTGASDTSIIFRIYGSDGSGNNPSSANWRIDDISFTVTLVETVPESAMWGAISGTGLLALCGRRFWRQCAGGKN